MVDFANSMSLIWATSRQFNDIFTINGIINDIEQRHSNIFLQVAKTHNSFAISQMAYLLNEKVVK